MMLRPRAFGAGIGEASNRRHEGVAAFLLPELWTGARMMSAINSEEEEGSIDA